VIEVKTQAELDAALKKRPPNEPIVVLGGTRTAPLVVRNAQDIVLRGSSHAVLRDSSHAELRDSSHAVLRDSSHAVLWGYSHAELWDSSHAVLWGYSHAVLWGYSHAVLWGSSHAALRDSSHAELSGSSHAVLRDSSHAVLRGSSHAVLWGYSHAEASKYAALHRTPGHSGTVKGGVVIDVPDVLDMSPAEWCEYHGVEVRRGFATLYKAVDDDLSTPKARAAGIFYTPGTKQKAPDFNPDPVCGGGLHASPSPAMAATYNSGATRYVLVKARLTDLVVIDDKVKARELRVVEEVDRQGDPVG